MTPAHPTSARRPQLGVLPPLALLLTLVAALKASAQEDAKVEFNRDIRSILSNNCFTCHGPDASKRQAGLRLDQLDGATAKLESGAAAVVPGQLEQSELWQRVTTEDDALRMPPAETGKKLTAGELELLRRWIEQGAPFAKHWSYEPPTRTPPPEVRDASWPRTVVDRFLLARLEREGLGPQAEVDRPALIRRVTLDLTGLPPTLDEVDAFVADTRPDAYERLVERLLASPRFGEHWARFWLDLARYADSAGYADDPPRTIWGYRDYVIQALNEDRPFDRFTIEQLAGDLLPDPGEDQLVATAFHRNTLTNNEGGTNDEEFRNVAIVDRVNTTMAVWMGTTMSCSQCHNHKYDPLSQEDFFRLFAVLNNTADADRRDESPLVELFSDSQLRQRRDAERERDELRRRLETPTPELLESLARWEERVRAEFAFATPRPASAIREQDQPLEVADDGTVSAQRGEPRETFTIELAPPAGPLTAVRLETLPSAELPGGGAGHGGGNFVVTRVLAELRPADDAAPRGRFLRIAVPGKQQILSLAEVQVFAGAENLAPAAEATQSSTAYDGPARLAIDGSTDGDYQKKSTTHTEISDDPWWELDLGAARGVDRIVVWNRTDNNLQSRLAKFRVQLLDEQRGVVWEQEVTEPPRPDRELTLSSARPLAFATAIADYSQDGFGPAGVLDDKETDKTGWAVGGELAQPHQLTLLPAAPVEVEQGWRLVLRIEQRSQHEHHTLGRFRIGVTSDPRAPELARVPTDLLRIARTAGGERATADQERLTQYFLREVAPELDAARQRLAEVEKLLANLKPMTSVPVQRELPADQRRKTNIQRRGNFLDLGDEVTAGLPTAFGPVPEGTPTRLTLAEWLVDRQNPLTARVIANRCWEAIFGIGLVKTSEEFGSQGEPPTHPELLDHLALDLMDSNWDIKGLLRELVLSSAYRQSSHVTPELEERDPENTLLARGPRFRLSAEMVRDQALAVAGLLSPTMFGPPVKPPQPELGVNAAFGSGIDWQTSAGEDRFRRGLYTTWRRSNPYPSMAAFDAPNREVCTLKRSRTNTPLQALVTLNDPVYVEAAQGLARRMVAAGAAPEARATLGFRLCLARAPHDRELAALMSLFEDSRSKLAGDPEKAKLLATQPLGPAPAGVEELDLAAWTVVANVLLNLDEVLMKR